MAEENYDRLFTKIDPPDFIVQEAKAQLGRDLRNSSYFKKSSFFSGAPQMKYILGALASAAVAAIIIVVNLNPGRISAKELVREVQAAYDQTVWVGKVHYLRFIFKVFEEEVLEFEKWIYPEGRQVRVQQRDLKSGAICGHAIMHGDRSYAMENSAFRARYEFRPKTSAQGKGDDKATKKQLNIIIKPTGDRDQVAGDQNMMQAFIVNDAFDYRVFEQQAPVEIVENLLNSPNVRYVGTEFDESSGRMLEVLEKRTEAGSFSLKFEFPAKYLGQVCWFCERLEDDDISVTSDTPLGEFLSQNNISPDVRKDNAIATETIRVFADTKRIYQTTLSIRENGEETYYAQKTFLNDEYVDYAPNLFDADKFGLIQVEDNPGRSRNMEIRR